MSDPTRKPEPDGYSGEQVKAWVESNWPASRLELFESANSYLLHVWVGGVCMVVERRGEEWGYTPNLSADDPGFDSGHPFVSSNGALVVARLGHRIAELFK